MLQQKKLAHEISSYDCWLLTLKIFLFIVPMSKEIEDVETKIKQQRKFEIMNIQTVRQLAKQMITTL